jgi:hypothetical protein
LLQKKLVDREPDSDRSSLLNGNQSLAGAGLCRIAA